MRALATIDRITALRRHPGADRLDIATIRGWQAVVPRGQFEEGEEVLFIEPDALLYEDEPAWGFLMPRGVRTAPDGRRGHVLRTARLRGEISQGLVMKLDAWSDRLPSGAGQGADVTALLPLRLWEPRMPATMEIAGPFPQGIPKTDEERLQNISGERLAALSECVQIIVTIKLDGSSLTMWLGAGGELRVASRNWELSPESGAYRVAVRSDAGRYMTDESMSGYYLQGELVGPGIQGNRGGLQTPDVLLFTLGIRDGGPALSPGAWPRELQNCAVPVAVRDGGWRLTGRDEWHRYADGLGTAVEGIVVRGYDAWGEQVESFKVINREYLIAGNG